MKRFRSLLPVLLASACSSFEETPLPPPDEEEPSEEQGPAPPVDAEGVAGASDEAPCGERTIAVLHEESGVDVIFCRLADGVVGFGERGPAGVPSVIGDLALACPGDVYRRLRPDSPVPAELDGSCTEVASRKPDERELATPIEPAPWEADWCSSSPGASNFYNDHCAAVVDHSKNVSGGWDELKYYYCTNTLWGWHDRNLAGSLGGEEGDSGYERVVACGGSIRFRAWWRWDVGDSWIGSLDFTVGSGGWAHWWIYEANGGEDIDVRFRVDSLGGTHRHTGVFEDW